ncbi:phosphatase PAP2 family protein [Amycolatopsis echigonensis]|uniref:Phosphatase PAP2 family protein n=1 Tax=Amycolatopsis echigonensis TaxID=2576905 RepID=A0A8E1VSU9_9PSEU|nr:phosphatase PAP2 family protein [Amycolatopsis echigonensis]MBB2497689.1 phosphatase PAP2 family protein [Amycolatopsis echigonensis]
MTTALTAAADSGIPDSGLMNAVNDFARATPWLHGLMYGYATYGIALFAVLLVAGWWSARRAGDPAGVAAAIWAGVGTLAAVGINQPIVNAAHEARPYTTMPHLLVLADRSADFSFPSDHATMAGAVAAGLFVARRRLLGWIATVAAVAIAFARVYIAAHYPHDVAAGLLLGALVAVLGWLLLKRILTRLVWRLGRTPLWFVVTSAPRESWQTLANGAEQAAEPPHRQEH